MSTNSLPAHLHSTLHRAVHTQRAKGHSCHWRHSLPILAARSMAPAALMLLLLLATAPVLLLLLALYYLCVGLLSELRLVTSHDWNLIAAKGTVGPLATRQQQCPTRCSCLRQ